MNTSDLIKIVASQTGLKPTAAARAVEVLFDTIIQTTAKGDDVRLIGFGSFVLSQRAARTARNPRTGEEIKVPAKRALRFRPGKAFREAID